MKLLYTTAEAMDALGVKQTTLYALLAERRIKAVKLGSRTMIDAESLEKLVASLRPGVFHTRGAKRAKAEGDEGATSGKSQPQSTAETH